MGMLARFAAMGGSAAAQTYVDDVFSAYTYSGTSATQTITNGIDLAGNGGLVWIKARNSATYWNVLFDTARGGGQLSSNNTDASLPSGSNVAGYVSYNSGGFTTQPGSLGFGSVGLSGNNYVSWTFRKAAKFFDVVTYTGNGTNRTISHSLGQVPGMIMVKRTDTTGSWMVYHRSLANTENLVLNTTAAKATNATAWNSTTADASVFSLGTHADVNTNGGTYVAYLFSHDTAADGIVQCGSFTTDGSGNATVSIGWEPQFVIARPTAAGYPWYMFDTQRNMSLGSNTMHLRANSSDAEASMGAVTTYPTATGFVSLLGPGSTAYIYLAIRRPNKPPTTGTQVYNAIAYTGNGVNPRTLSVGFAADLGVVCDRNGIGLGGQKEWSDRLRGSGGFLRSTGAGAEDSARYFTFRNTDVLTPSVNGGWNESGGGGGTYINHFFRRAPGVFDVVCYTGTGSAHTESHNLGVAPELWVVKIRGSASGAWAWGAASLGANKLFLMPTAGSGVETDTTYWNNSLPSASTLSVGTHARTNGSGYTYVAYLFATKSGISKVGSYTGNGSNQTIDCGFTAGARFVLVIRTDVATTTFQVFDTARGIVSGNDPHLSLDSTSAEVTTDDSIDPASSGFIVNQVAATNINVNNATYVYLAFA